MTRPRKRYRPKPIGRPIGAPLRDQLILPSYSALQTLQYNGDPAALDAARHTLAALVDYMLVALRDAGRPTDEIESGLAALVAVIRRHEAGAPFRATAAELESLRAAVRHADEVLGTLRTDQIIRAVAAVNAAIDAGEVVA